MENETADKWRCSSVVDKLTRPNLVPSADASEVGLGFRRKGEGQCPCYKWRSTTSQIAFRLPLLFSYTARLMTRQAGRGCMEQHGGLYR